jgi:hypothetical protein
VLVYEPVAEEETEAADGHEQEGTDQ